MKRPKLLTMKAVAERCGVSTSTVSRAFSRPELVKEDVRERILQVAAGLGYQPNRVARSLATGKLEMIGLMVSDITNPFFPPLVRQIQKAAARRWSVLLLDADEIAGDEQRLIDWVRGQVDGLIVASPRSSDESLAQVLAAIPSVVVNREVHGVSSVVVDNSQALAEAGDHLRKLGHADIALVRGPEASWAAQQRAVAIQAWGECRGVNILDLGAYPSTFEGGREAGHALAAGNATAAFAFDDLMAAGIVAGLHDRSKMVPGDVSVVGCDDVLLARTSTPSMTTVTAPMGALGRSSVELLEAEVAGDDPRWRRVVGRLAIRGSVGPKG